MINSLEFLIPQSKLELLLPKIKWSQNWFGRNFKFLISKIDHKNKIASKEFPIPQLILETSIKTSLLVKIPTKKQMKEREICLDIQFLKKRVFGSISIKT